MPKARKVNTVAGCMSFLWMRWYGEQEVGLNTGYASPLQSTMRVYIGVDGKLRCTWWANSFALDRPGVSLPISSSKRAVSVRSAWGLKHYRIGLYASVQVRVLGLQHQSACRQVQVSIAPLSGWWSY